MLVILDLVMKFIEIHLKAEVIIYYQVIREDDDGFSSAINQLHVELGNDPQNPDILTLLGYSYGKTKNHQNALNYYQSALQVEPQHKGANQLLGKYYLHTNQPTKALKQLALHESSSQFSSNEYTRLKKSIEQYQR